ncbi:MAG: SulP family inorganic anion transporter, partial [Spongiibacteraceae bacterium]|nr:SulP family inorganic anion transporter [Spongiibacteraceae bacterium]
MKRLLPPWAARYRRAFLRDDLIAGLVVALMLIPQGLAYATLVGVPPHYGLYARLLPALRYALCASSSVL